ncbi:MAG: phosphate acetyltransferase [Sedimentisphaerales bacterium]|nr:phosphate acetyltransferase [Sedimentisphaerales bacterium]
MDILRDLKDSISCRGYSVVLPEGRDERIVAAARRIKDEGIAVPVLLGNVRQIKESAHKAAVTLDDITTIDPKAGSRIGSYVQAYVARRKDISKAVARRIVTKPLFYAGLMVACGDADAMVAGAASATATVIQAGVLTIGLMPGISTPSSYFVMVVPKFLDEDNKIFIFADCAVNVDPTAEQLADIALASAESAKRILPQQPRVAMLSFSTKGSGLGQSVKKVIQALEIAKERNGDLVIDGEFQADSAIIPQVAAKKVKEVSLVAGKANVLIFPDLNAANIAYKLTQYLSEARAIGPVLQGFAKPITDLSRGASVDDIISAVVLTLAKLL